MNAALEQGAVRVLIADDEPPGRKRLERLLRLEPHVELVGTAKNGVEAVEAIRQLHPDLVFLDIQMPYKTGLEVVQEIGPEAMPLTIFVTAYDEHALKAFDLAAVDYLVKPYDDERFEQAFRRARQMVEMKGQNRVLEQLLAVLHRPAYAPAPAGAARHLERIAVQLRGKMTVVPVGDIEYITASGAYSELHVRGQRHLVREPIQSLEDQLDPQRFLRIHRSAIVRVDLVDSLIRTPSSDYEVQLRNGPRLRIGRSRREEVQRRLGRL